ncbi:MAG TPA: hypothetical protein PK504_05205 [Ferruginibacter sp.]|nr:hypothetical protein [Ferruginibacter sp.]HRE62547.1 hypothetical protein [Ferruginibacter sp.]
MKKFLYFFLFFPAVQTLAQVPEDAIRYSFYTQSGTARSLAIGGAMGSLGGDISANYVNPAGIGFFKTREVVLSPGLNFGTQKANYRETANSIKKNGFLLGTSGIIIGQGNSNNKKQSSAFSAAITQTANFNNTIHYRGLNNYSSYSEMLAEEFAKSGYSIDDVLNTMSPLPYTSALGLQTYLIDTITINGNTVVRGAAENILDAGQAIQQDMYRKTSGGIYEIALSGAYNWNEKWFLGGSLGIPIVNFKSNTVYSEFDTSSNTNNGFNSFTMRDNFKSIGAGANLKLGVIYRPQDYLRFGLALHTPSIIFMRDDHTASIETNLESPTGQPETYRASSTLFTNGLEGTARYLQNNAWRAIISGSYVFREVENVKKQKGFITADIEYVNHKSSRFKSDAETPTNDEKVYYKALNNVIKDMYKGAFNFRVGGELKFNIVMARLGFGYYSNPYKDLGYKASRMILSGGLGYRHKGMFVDVTYAHQIHKNADFPYRLEDRLNTFASTKQTLGGLMATIGWKF